MKIRKNSRPVDGFAHNGILRNRHARTKLIACIIAFLAIVGGTLLTILRTNKNAGDAEAIRNILINLATFDAVIIVVAILVVYFDINRQINSRVFQMTEKLIEDYQYAFLVDPKNDTYKRIRSIKKIKKKGLTQESFLNEINKYIDNNIFFKDSYFVKDELDYTVILRKLEKSPSYSIYYRELDGTEICWTEMNFSYYSENLLLISIQKRGNELVEEKLFSIVEKEYFALFTVDLDAVEIKVIKGFPNDSEFIEGTVLPYSMAMKEFAEKQDDATKELFDNLSDIDFIKQELLTENKHSFVYKAREFDGGLWICVTCHVLFRNTDGTPAVFALEFTKLDSFGNSYQELQLKLKDALSMAESANKAKTIFLNNMSHDIHTPMNAIISYTNLASNHIDNIEQVSDYLRKISQASNQLLSFINDSLDMNRIESGRITLEETSEDLREIVHYLNTIIKANIQTRQINYECDVDIINKNIICDKSRLRQALLNILSNAVKFTGDNGTISFTVKQLDQIGSSAGNYEFRIKDNGIGMSKEFVSSIFEPFAKEKRNVKRGTQGSGLGMAITKNIIDMMHGKIDVFSTANVGTEVVVTIPLQYVDERNLKTIETVKDYSKQDFVGTKILIVEDNAINREIAADILSDYGFIIKCAEDGDIAVDMVKNANEGDIDIILMDIKMPNMDGYEATRQIRALKTPVSKVPIVALTAKKFKQDRIEAISSGMDEQLIKPLQIDQLLKVMSKFLKK